METQIHWRRREDGEFTNQFRTLQITSLQFTTLQFTIYNSPIYNTIHNLQFYNLQHYSSQFYNLQILFRVFLLVQLWETWVTSVVPTNFWQQRSAKSKQHHSLITAYKFADFCWLGIQETSCETYWTDFTKYGVVTSWHFS